MKRILSLILALCLVCFCGCTEESSEATATEEPQPGIKYKLIGIQLEDGGFMDEDELKKSSGGEDFYLRLYDDGTAKLRISPGEPVDMQYDATHLWQPNDPDTKAIYEIVDGVMTVVDYPFIYTFRKTS